MLRWSPAAAPLAERGGPGLRAGGFESRLLHRNWQLLGLGARGTRRWSSVVTAGAAVVCKNSLKQKTLFL